MSLTLSDAYTIPQEHLDFRDTIRQIVQEKVAPRAHDIDASAEYPWDVRKLLAENDILGLPFDSEHGGTGTGTLMLSIAVEEIAKACASSSLILMVQDLGTLPIQLFGSDEQKQRYLTPLARGERLAAWGLTEPGSGSDAAAMRTTAVRDGDHWVLNGSKAFITHGKSGDTMVVMAVTDRARGSKGISAFIVERGTPGLIAGKKEDKLGMRASETCEVIFQNCRVPAAQMVGEEGQGFIQTLQVLDAGRIGIAALAVGLAQGAWEAARDYAAERRQFGRAINTFQSIRWKLLDNASRVDAARLLTYRAAWLKDQGRKTTLESSMAKLFASEIAVRASEDGVQIFGGYGFVKDYPAEKYFRDVKLTTIGEGTSEVQRLVIARQLLAA